ncbi:MAG: ribonuclease P protein component [Alistipes sp.]|nr:ribonuclease P protein component [Alistipes sp.]
MDSVPNTALPLRRATLPKSERLSGRDAVDALFRGGASGFVYPYRYIYSVGPQESGSPGDTSPVRILFSVPKRYHKRANKRNLLKRRAREAYRLQKLTPEASACPLKIALIYSSKEIENYARINNAIRKIISEIQSRL